MYMNTHDSIRKQFDEIAKVRCAKRESNEKNETVMPKSSSKPFLHMAVERKKSTM